MQPEKLVEEIRRRWERNPDMSELSVFWVTVPSRRDEFADMLRQARGQWPLVPVILRASGLFRDPNAVMNDVTSILHDAKQEILYVADCARRFKGVGLVVLSRRGLRLAVTSSPLQLPEWFPVMAGKEVAARIDDLTWSVHVKLSDGVVAGNELRRMLYELDLSILARVKETQESEDREVQGLWESIRRTGEDDISHGIREISKTLDKIVNPTDFRPSTAIGPTMVGRLWYEANRNSPDRLPRIAKQLARALRADSLALRGDLTPLTAVLGRPTSLIEDAGIEWCFHLIVTLRSACQLVTAAAHADQYPMFPETLLRAVSLDLRRFIDDAIQILESR